MPIFDLSEVKLNVAFGWSVMIALVVSILTSSIDKIFVLKQFDPAVLAHYSLAADLHAKMYFLLYAINTSVYTLIIRSKASNERSLRLLQVSVFGVALILIGYYLPLVVFAPQILSWWISPEFSGEASFYVRVMFANTVLYLFVAIAHNMVQASGYGRKILISNFLGLIGFVICLGFLPQMFGILGIILAHQFSLVVQLVYLGLIVHDELKRPKTIGA